MSDWLSWQALVIIMVANSAPVVASWLLGPRLAWPLDFGLKLHDGARLLGAHKTWRGLVIAALAAAGASTLIGLPAAVGAVAGAAAMLGDALSSFVKRRLKHRPGAWLPGLDQGPEAALPLVVMWRPLGLDSGSVTGTLVVFIVLGLLASRTLGSSRPGA